MRQQRAPEEPHQGLQYHFSIFNRTKGMILLTLDPRRPRSHLNVLPGHEISFTVFLSIHAQLCLLTSLPSCNSMASSESVLACTDCVSTTTHRTLSARNCLREEWAAGARVCMSCRRSMRLTHLENHQTSIQHESSGTLTSAHIPCL